MYEPLFLAYVTLLGITSIVVFLCHDEVPRVGWLYLIGCIPPVVFTMFRPFGLMRDDVGYVQRFQDLSLYELEVEQIFSREPLWNLINALGKAIWNDARVLLITAGFVLMIKLYILYRLSVRNKLLVLFMYMCMFWQLHDLTQLRGSMAVMFFLLFLYLRLQGFNRQSLARTALVGAIASHAQAFAALLLLGKKPLVSANNFVVYVLAVSVFLAFGLFPDLSLLSTALYGIEDRGVLFDSYEMYQLRAEQGDYEAFSHMPIIFTVSEIVYLVVSRELKDQYSSDRIQLVYKSIMIGVTLAFLFASVSDVQVRFYEFFFIGGLLFVGMLRSTISASLCFLLAVLYYLKFNVLWSIWDMDFSFV